MRRSPPDERSAFTETALNHDCELKVHRITRGDGPGPYLDRASIHVFGTRPERTRGPRASVPPRMDHTAVGATLERFIEYAMRDKDLPSLSIALVDDQQIVWA